ncbi:cytochrome P450 CYP736A12-like [Cornus florida]|uniref:cytochrome P450 CYP736A12-like n=1 Tax=Cornus florida TaxID=4283 RepID=UPI00289D65C9|nr:cytochrome P450 CYP736A12-like [Cornus florida]
MSPFTFSVLLVLIGALWSFIHLRLAASSPRNHQKLPPGPRGLPVIGNLHMVTKLPHLLAHHLAKKYGPIMSMRLGSVLTIVISSPQAAELILKTHDTVFASRPKVQVPNHFSYGGKGVVFTEHGSYWRNVRKFCTLELLSVTKVDSFAGVRREKIESMVQLVMDAAKASEVVDLSNKVGEVIEDMTYKMVVGCSRDDRFDLKGIVHEALHLAGAFNLADYIPFLGVLDLQGLTRRLKATSSAIDKFLEVIINDHVEEAARNGQQRHDKNFIHIMLSLMMNQSASTTHDKLSFMINRTNIKAIVLDVIAAAIDTSTIAIEWALSELIKHPRVMSRLQEELKSVVGMRQMVEETDLAKFNYLDMVIKETLRLHPVGPLLIPRESIEDIVIDGYYIPKKSQIIVNAWALGHDPNVWSDNVDDFFPERFIGSNIDLRGRNFQLLPFGSGRRGCPGMHLGLTTIRLMVAQLVHCFDWKLPDGMSCSELDMNEKFDLAMPKAKHLLAVPTYRLGDKSL